MKGSNKLLMILFHLLASTLREERRLSHRSIISNIGREEILSRDTVHNMMIHMTMIVVDASSHVSFRIIASKAIGESTRPWRRHDSVGM